MKVFAITTDDYTPDEKPIGEADTAVKAARLIRKYIAETTGDGDSGITEHHVKWSMALQGYFIAD